MKKNLLILSIALIGAFALHAQTDVTPTRYNFANQPEGAYLLDATSPSNWNTPASWTDAKEKFNNGYFVIAGGPVISGQPLDNPLLKSIQEGINIVDLKGQIGKVLVVKGNESTYPFGAPMGKDYTGQGYNLNFYAMPEKFTAKTPIRFRMVFSVVENTLRMDQSILDKFYFVTYTGNPIDNSVNVAFPSIFFAKKDANGQYEEDDDGNYMYDPTTWEVFESDMSTDDSPYRLKIEITNMKTATLLIKEVKFIKNPTGKPEQRSVLKLAGGTGLFNVTAEKTSMRFSVNNDGLTLFDLKPNEIVRVNNVSGQLVKEINAKSETETIKLDKGFYVVSTNTKLAKVIVK